MSNNRQYILKICTLVIILVAACPAFGRADSNSALPNIVIFFADDAGYADFGFQGSDRHLTPAIDQLARDSTVFTQAYASSSVCSPSRAGLLTGRYQNRFGIEFNLPGPANKRFDLEEVGLPEFEKTFGSLAIANGYVSAMIGKWHLGQTENYLPDQRGFNEYFGLLGASSGYFSGKARRIVSNYKRVDFKKLPYLTDAFGDEAVSFVERNATRPFLLYMPFNAPHGPMHAKPEYLARFEKLYKSRKQAANAALTQSMDENVGKVVSTLKRLGLYQNSLIIFTNDNGGLPSDNGSNNEPLRGAKGTVLEGGLRVPLIIHWPGKLKTVDTYSGLVSLLDVFPTVVNTIGAKLPGDRVFDGTNLLPHVLENGRDYQPHESLFWRVNWASAVRHGHWKLIRTPDASKFLYNLLNDPSETTDLSNSYPNIMIDLENKLDRWERKMVNPLWVPDRKWKKFAQSLY